MGIKYKSLGECVRCDGESEINIYLSAEGIIQTHLQTRTNEQACARSLFRCRSIGFHWVYPFSFFVFVDRCRVIEMYSINIIKFVVNEKRLEQNKYTNRKRTQKIALIYWGEIILLNSIASISMKPNTQYINISTARHTTLVNKFVLSQQFNRKANAGRRKLCICQLRLLVRMWNRAVLVVAFNTFTR